MSFAVRDGITPGLAAAAAKIRDRKPILEAMGLQLVSITKRAFSDDSLRAAAWPARKKPAPHNLLRKSGAMWQSIRIAEITNDHVTAGSDRVYAAIQQLGSAKSSGRGSGVLPRPFFPFAKDGRMTATAEDKVRKIALAKIASLLRAS
jgi:phage gpG-like protein